MAVSVLPENFFVDLIPTKVMELDTTGVLHATLSGFQDHSDDIRAYISYINKLIDPFAGHPIPGTCVATNYTDEFGLNVTRTVLSFDLESDKTYQAFEAGNLTQDEAKAWMGDVLAIDPSVISSVETVVDPFKTVYQPMIGYLANNIGAIFPTSNADDTRNADLVASHFSRLPIKGTSQSIETAGLLAGFDSVHVNPLWGRLTPRNPLDVGLDVNNADFSETTVVEPTIETTEFYDPLSYRDGPFYTWSTRLSLLNNTNFVSQANGANPYVKWKIDGLTITNFRGVYTAASTYNSGDVVVSSTGRTFLVKASTTTAPPTSLLSVSFLMPAVDSSVLTTVTDSSWMSVGQLVTLYSAGTLEVGVIDGTSVTFVNKGANGNLSPGITVNAGSVIVSQDSSIWLEITPPSAGIYTLSGGEPNVEATATLSSTISVEGLAEGVSFNGLEILVDSVPNVISTISTSDATPAIATVTTTQSHGLTSGSYVFISNVTPFDYVGLYSITVTGQTSFTYQLASNVYEAGTAADGIVPYYSNGDFEATIFDRLSSIKYRTSYYNLVLTIKEATINAISVPAKPNPSVIEQVGSGSLVASPPYLPFSGTTEVAGNTQQVNTLWLASLAAETEVILNSVKPSTRYIRQFSTGVLYEDTFGYAEYVNQALVYDKTSSLSGTITGPIYPRTATLTIVRVPSDTQFFRVISFGDDSPTLSISPELVVTFNTVVGTQYQVESKDSLFAPWYPATSVFTATSSVTTYQLVPYETVVLTGQSSQGDPNQVTFSGTESYGAVSTDLNYYTGVFSATRPAQFPSGNSVVANWLLTDSGTIRTEPTTAQKQAGTIGFLPRAEDQFGYDPQANTEIFAFLSDYGFDDGNELAVKNLIDSWSPDFVLAGGDHIYGLDPSMTLAQADAEYVAKVYDYYGPYIDAGTFYPTIGNHDTDYDPSNPVWFRSKFPSLFQTNTKNYYRVRPNNGPVEFFVLSSGYLTDGSLFEPSGNTVGSVQYNWLVSALSTSTAKFKVAFFHHPPYTDGINYSPGFPALRWNFGALGIDLVLSGHEHNYERYLQKEIPYVVAGIGGASLRGYVAGGYPDSVIDNPPRFGAIRFTANQNSLLAEVFDVSNDMIDTFSIVKTNDSQFGSRPTLYPDVNEWTRPLEHEILDRDLEPVYGNEEKFPGKFVASADSNNGLSYGVYLLQGTFPYRFRFTELSGQNPLPTIAYSGNNQYYVGIRYGQLLACPERTFSASMQSGLSAWIPFNAHPDEDLDINCVYPVIRQMTVTGLIPQDRVWDSNRGWVTYCRGLEASISIEPLLNEFTLAFWFKPNAYVSTQTILSMGPLVVKMASISTLTIYYSGVLKATLTVSGFSFISIRQKNATLVTGVNSTYTSYSVVPVTDYVETLDFISVSTGAEYYLQDFKLWSTFKLSSDVTTFYQPSGVATQLATQPTPVEISTTGDRWFLRVLASGFVASDLQPQSNLVEVTGQFTSTSGGTTTVTSLGTITEYPGNLLPVANYDVQGRFIADSGRSLVGLAGGVLPTLPRRLGEAFLPTSAINRDPVSPNTGLPSGINPEWLADTSAGYVRIVSAPFSGTGGVVSTEATGTVSPWPNPANYTNPLVDRIWIEGDSGTIYQLGVGGYVSSPTFTVTPVPINALNEYPSGAVTVLTNGTTQLSVNSSDVVYSTGTTNTTTPITYLYRHEYGITTFTGSEGWIPTESSTLYDGSPSLYSTGQLMWSSTASTADLDVGHYRLRITAHNRGQVARTFEGFDVEVTVGQNITFPMVLSPNSTSEETYYDFYVNETISSPWLVQIYWGGIVDDPTRGITYQLVVDSIEIDRLKTQVYRVGPGVSLTEVSTVASGTTSLGNLTPGGWLAEVTSTGTIYSWEHEANINPSVGGVEEAYTLSELLTMSTDNKVSRVMLSPSYSGSTVLPNPSATSAPSISSHTQTLSPGTTPIQVGYGLGIDVVASGAVSYIWNFWDSSVETTDTGTIQKVVNQGGTLPWTCTVANEWGQSTNVTDSIVVNSPPVIQSATLSNNDLPPTYATALTGTISDPNSASPILVWLDGVTPTTISTLSHGTTEGTFNLPFSVATSATKILHAVDVNGGTTLLDIDVRALPFKPIIAAVIAQPKSQRIGNNSTVRFTCRATDPNGGGTPTFAWDFLTAEGWVSSDFSSVTGFSSISGGYTSSGLTQNLSGGVYQNTVLLPSIANQTAGSRRAKLTITPTVGDAVVLYGSVTLIENHAPVIQRFDILSPDNIQSGVATTIQAIVTDQDNDILSYSWAMTNVSDPITNLNSNPIVVHPNGTLLTGTLTASDPYGSYDSMSIPAVLVSSKTAVDGTIGVSLVYRPYAMSPTPATFSWGEIPSGLTLINGTILGVPQIAGITATQLTATSASGTDVRDFTWRIYTAATPPLSPTNFIVNGDGNNPRYASGQTLTLQWTITNDGGTVPGSAIELCQFDGTLVKTIEVGSGINVLVLTSNDILSSFGSYQDIDIKVYALRNSTRSVFPAETVVTYTY
tara:strand:- start:577 stop:8088 length:7512 start_codon:yes stop_codon:yes gene_type:complete